jgi:diadenosine tetraphosphate (Ap4A) HIT family hydrolase
MQCKVCLSNQAKLRISPGPTIFTGKYWLVEHCYPSQTAGRLVIALKRHVHALHELTTEEYIEFAKILELTISSLHACYLSDVEYCACFSEQPGFEHIHFHIIPRGTERTVKGPQFMQTNGPQLSDDEVIQTISMLLPYFNRSIA